MADIQSRLPVKIVDDTSGAIATVTAGNAVKIDGSAVTHPVSGTITNVPSGTQTVITTEGIADNAGFTDGTSKVLMAGFAFDEVAGTSLTENDAAAARIDAKRAQVLVIEDATTRGQRASVGASGALKVDGSAFTQPVSGTFTATPSGTQPVSGTVTAVQSGTYTVIENPATTGIVCSYGTAATVAAASTGTISYTVTAAKTLYLKSVIASSSGAPCKVIVDYGAGPTTLAVGFYSSANPFLVIPFNEAPGIAASTVVNVKIRNDAQSTQDLYATIMGQEI
jgi:hypothetical protein